MTRARSCLPTLLAVALATAWLNMSAAESPQKPAPIWTGCATNAQGAVLAKIAVEAHETPDLADWAKRAGQLCAEWYPKVSALLASEGFALPDKVTLRFRADMKGVAAASGSVINFAAGYVRGHTNDWGMVVHELTHVVQSYPPGGPGWLVEGIADYIRLSHFEPAAPRPRINPDKASYRDAYKTTAIFLAWVEKQHDAKLVSKLNAALRQRKYSPELWKEATGKTVDELWTDFTAELRSKQAVEK
ncbi:MAG: basic secretory protein-like protein [Limisphaerales bacterium]